MMSNEREDGMMEEGEWGAPEEAADAAAILPKQRTSNKATRAILIGAVLIAAIGLIVGLSVGLTRGESDPESLTVPEPSPTPGTSSPSEPSSPTDSPTQPSPTDPIGKDTVPTDPGVLNTITGVLNSRLTTFSSDIVRGYLHVGELKQDLTEVFKFLCAAVILYDAGEAGYDERPEWGFGMDVLAVADAEEAVPSPTDNGSPSAEGVTDFDTLNQEEGVDEADIVKANDDYVFLAYGDMLVVYHSKTGALVTNVTMPPIEQDQTTGGGPGDDVSPAEAKSSFYYGPIKPQIKALMLNEDKLVCVTGGSSGYNYWWGGGGEESIFSEVDDTLIQTYRISSLNTTGELDLINHQYVSGHYNAGRSIGNNAHLVTTANINFWPLVGPLRRWSSNFSDIRDSEEYKIAALEVANTTIPRFVDRFIQELGATNETVGGLVRLALWDTATSDAASRTANRAHGGIVFSGYTQITSFDMSEEADELELSISGAFIPSVWGETYSTTDMMIFAGNGYQWTQEGYLEKTYLLGFKLDGATSSPVAVGAVPGRIIDQYSVSIFEEHLRVATTATAPWRWWESDTVDEDESRTQNQIIFLNIPEVGDTTDEAVFTEVNRLDDLGKKDEVFTTVRMYGFVGYAVTFLRTDPFYVLDLDPLDPQILGELNITGFSTQLYRFNGEEDLLVSLGFEADGGGRVSGFAISLFNSANPSDPTLVYRLVVEEDDDVWSSSEGSWDPKAARLVTIDPENSIFIVPLSIYQPWPKTEGNFDGFVAYDVNRTHISERLRVSHVESENFYDCYYPAYLAPRSLVYDGNMHTMKGHSVLSTNLDTGENMFELSLYKPQNNTEDCVYWLF